MTDVRLEQEPEANAEDAAAQVSSAPNVVRLPNGHIVVLRPELTVPLGMAALRALNSSVGRGMEAAEYALSALWLGVAPNGEAYTIASWDFLDDQGNEEPITEESITRLLPFNDGGYEVAGAAGRLYGEHVMRPFLRAIETPSSNGRTANGTHRKSPNGAVSRTRSRRSSPRRMAGPPSGR